ncbi:GNAT family N-acetyltransferase [Pseudovibrio sp. W64]|uniref:GNAT family N-acetyltransferase n=1 Tax=Pseudovibrio sp. W64 TaxID=1735583 RepID=UPI0007AEC33A|nr:GNAT family N-acetyltransferase [Pseudovibrio sp. W64]
MNGLSIHVFKEDEIDRQREAGIATLLGQCFPQVFEGRTFFKQLPHFRLIVEERDEIIGQVGVDHRVIKVGEQRLKIYGLIDLCVTEERRNQGIASTLLQAAENLAMRADVDFIVLFADDGSLYRKHGFLNVSPALTKWLAIEDVASAMLLERDLSECFMVKPVGDMRWPEGHIDMLGYLF